MVFYLGTFSYVVLDVKVVDFITFHSERTLQSCFIVSVIIHYLYHKTPEHLELLVEFVASSQVII